MGASNPQGHFGAVCTRPWHLTPATPVHPVRLVPCTGHGLYATAWLNRNRVEARPPPAWQSIGGGLAGEPQYPDSDAIGGCRVGPLTWPVATPTPAEQVGAKAMDDKQPQQTADQTAVRIVPAPDHARPELDYLEPVRTGEARQFVSRYQEALEMAATLRTSLRRAGVISGDSDVHPLLSDQGEPVLHVELTLEGKARLEQLLEHMARSSPPSGRTESRPPPTWDSG